MKKINNAYTLATVIFILTFLSIALLLTTFFVSFYLNNASRRLDKFETKLLKVESPEENMKKIDNPELEVTYKNE